MHRETPVHQRSWSVLVRLFPNPKNVHRAIRGYLDDYFSLCPPEKCSWSYRVLLGVWSTPKIFFDLSDVSWLRRNGPRTRKIFLDLKSQTPSSGSSKNDLGAIHELALVGDTGRRFTLV
jgi:hypothetical protein